MFSSSIPGRIAPKGREPNLPGDKYNRLTLLEEVPRQSVRPSKRLWRCVCECGKGATVTLDHLKTGHTNSCGCWNRERLSETRTTHGMTGTRTRKIWSHIVQRCTNQNHPKWFDYGGRGITLDPRWLKFENFFADMGEAVGNLSIDRIDNSKGYSRENCRYTDATTQARNTRNNRRVSYRENNICLAEACEIAGLPQSRVGQRLNKLGWSIPRALESPEFGEPLLESPN